MEGVAVVAAVVVVVVNGLAAAWGGWRWWRVEPSRLFWWFARAGQAAAWGLAIVAVVMLVTGYEPTSGLFWLYAFLPVAIGFVGEQVRILSAETVLAARGLPDAAAVRTLPEREQHSVALAIARREMGIVALAAAVTAFLALRAIGTLQA